MKNINLIINLVILLLVTLPIISTSGCNSGSANQVSSKSEATSEIFYSLPPIPIEAATENARLRSIVYPTSIFALGKDEFLASSNTAVNGAALDLDAGTVGSQRVSWAIWRLSMNNSNPTIGIIDVNFVDMNSKYWVAIANYKQKSWQWLGEYSEQHLIYRLETNEYLSSAGNFYVAILTHNGAKCSVVNTGAYTSTDTNAPVPVSKTTAEAVPGGLFLSWIPVNGADVIGYRLKVSGTYLESIVNNPYALIPYTKSGEKVSVATVDTSGNLSAETGFSIVGLHAGTLQHSILTTSANSGVAEFKPELTVKTEVDSPLFDFDINDDGVFEVTNNATGSIVGQYLYGGVFRPVVKVKDSTGAVRSLASVTMVITGDEPPAELTYPIVDTNQTIFYGDINPITEPTAGQNYHGQDAHYSINPPSYTDNGDGTITDNVSGLMWVKARGNKMTWNSAKSGAALCNVGGYSDWRMPSIKELYSLIVFTGKSGLSEAESVPYIDTKYFDFKFGDTSSGERLIDCQDWSATEYVSTTMNNDATVFGVNFADGRIKGYPKFKPGTGGATENVLYIRYVRGNTDYGTNKFNNNGDGTVSDTATGLMWTRDDSAKSYNWKDGLAWVQAKNTEKYLGYSDWRMPSAKELQSIVDYTRSLDTTKSAAIDPVFSCSSITDEGGNTNYPYFWANTTHLDSMGAVYLSFGEALGWMEMPPMSGNYQLLDVHGSGAQRSDPKSGDPADYPYGKGPQGDVIRIFNYIRLVRTIK